MLSDNQLKLIAETLSNVGITFFASLVIPFFVGDFQITLFMLGIVGASASWSASLLIINQVTL